MDYRNMFDFSAKKVLITGGTGTLGSEFAYAFASCGADVVISGRDEIKAGEVLKKCCQHKAVYDFVKCDLSDITSIGGMVSDARRILGGLDILCNHAGFSIRRPALECTENDWERLMEIDLKAPFFTACEAARSMKASGGGMIINTASVSSARGHKELSIYAAAKGGIRQMTKSLAHEWAPFGIRVNAVAPGYIPTTQTADILDDKVKKNKLLSKIPLGRFGKPEEIAAVVLFLASTGSSYITGQTLFVEGGRMID